MADNKIYFKLKNLIDKFYYVESNFDSVLNIEDNNEDSKYILKLIKDSVIKKLDNKYFSKEKTTIKIDDTTIEYYNYKDTEEISVKSSGIEIFNIEINNNKDITGTLLGTMSIKGTYDDNNLNLSISYLTLVCDLSIKTEETVKNDSYDVDFDIALKFTESNQDHLSLSIKSKNTISKLDKIDEVEIDSSTDFNEISEEDQTIISNKLSELEIFKKIMDLSTSGVQSTNVTNNIQL